MKILSLNCQWAYNPNLKKFLQETLASNAYDFLLLQEADPAVMDILREKETVYKFLNAFNKDAGSESQLCIAYRKEFPLMDTSFYSFSKIHLDPVRRFKHPALGLLCAIFTMSGRRLLVGSLHLHPTFEAAVRRREMAIVREEILKFGTDIPAVFGGDCNFGLPFERRRAARILAPEFVCATPNTGPTLHSRYTEWHPALPNRFAIWLATVGLGISLRADQIYVDSNTALRSVIQARILPDRVSDHSPVELTLELS